MPLHIPHLLTRSFTDAIISTQRVLSKSTIDLKKSRFEQTLRLDCSNYSTTFLENGLGRFCRSRSFALRVSRTWTNTVAMLSRERERWRRRRRGRGRRRRRRYAARRERRQGGRWRRGEEDVYGEHIAAAGDVLWRANLAFRASDVELINIPFASRPRCRRSPFRFPSK